MAPAAKLPPGLSVTPAGDLSEANVFFLLGFGLVRGADGRLLPGAYLLRSEPELK